MRIRSVADLRFRLPVANDQYAGVYNATAYGIACIQQGSNLTDTSDLNPIAAEILLQSASAFFAPPVDGEDCELRYSPRERAYPYMIVGLTVDVYAPANATRDSKLPVVYVSSSSRYLDVCFVLTSMMAVDIRRSGGQCSYLRSMLLTGSLRRLSDRRYIWLQRYCNRGAIHSA